MTEILEDEKPFKVGNANARADVNGDGKIHRNGFAVGAFCFEALMSTMMV